VVSHSFSDPDGQRHFIAHTGQPPLQSKSKDETLSLINENLTQSIARSEQLVREAVSSNEEVKPLAVLTHTASTHAPRTDGFITDNLLSSFSRSKQAVEDAISTDEPPPRSISPVMPVRLIGEKRSMRSPDEEANELEYFPPPPKTVATSPLASSVISASGSQGMTSNELRRRISGNVLRHNSGDDFSSAWRRMSVTRSNAGSTYTGSENGDNTGNSSSPTGTWPRRVSSGQRMGAVGALGIGAGLERRESLASLASRGSGSLGRKNSIASLVQMVPSSRASVIAPSEVIMDVSDEGSGTGSSEKEEEEESPQWAGWFGRR